MMDHFQTISAYTLTINPQAIKDRQRREEADKSLGFNLWAVRQITVIKVEHIGPIKSSSVESPAPVEYMRKVSIPTNWIQWDVQVEVDTLVMAHEGL